MQPCTTKLTIRVNGDTHEVTKSTVQSHQDTIKNKPNDVNDFNTNGDTKIKRLDLNSMGENVLDVSSSSECSTEDENTTSCDDSHKQLVPYNPLLNGETETIPVPDPISYRLPSFHRVLPSVGTFTVQCANCFKWRLIPSQEKYEEIREHITNNPFVCQTAREWRPDVSCDDPPDIEQDGSRLWAIDKPNIAQPPPGWQRLLRIRGEGSTKFADVYYTAPTGTRMRSMPEIEKYLSEHPEYAEQGVTLAQFSFQVPKPLQENYVRKRTPRVSALPGSLEPSPDKMMALPGPEQNTDLQLGMPGFSAPYALDPMNPTPKKARIA